MNRTNEATPTAYSDVCTPDDWDMYIDHLDKVTALLFDKGGEMDIAEPKNELFDMLFINYCLRKDLIKLKTAQPHEPA